MERQRANLFEKLESDACPQGQFLLESKIDASKLAISVDACPERMTDKGSRLVEPGLDYHRICMDLTEASGIRSGKQRFYFNALLC